MKKFIETSILKELGDIMRNTERTLDKFKGDRVDVLEVFVLCNYPIASGKFSIAVEQEELERVIRFVIDNYRTLQEGGNILFVFSQICAVYQRKIVAKKPKGLYFQMGLDEKIRSIKALREMAKMGFDCLNDHGLKWAKKAVEAYVVFGPVPQKFIDMAYQTGAGQYIAKISGISTGFAQNVGIPYEEFMREHRDTPSY